MRKVLLEFSTNVKLSIQFTAGRLLHIIKKRDVYIENDDIHVTTPVNRRTALWVFVKIDLISINFRDNMNNKLRCLFYAMSM